MIKTFKGRIADEGIQRIRLSTNDGMAGYKVTKFEGVGDAPGTNAYEGVLQLFSVEPSAAASTVNFDDPTLMGICIIAGNAASFNYPYSQIVIFDNVKVNQDIFVTYVNTVGSEPGNFYVELEQMKLDLNEATVATLKDMRGRE